MLWKMWVHPGGQMLVVNAEDMDEAFRKARDLDPDFTTAQAMDEDETRRYRDMLMFLWDADHDQSMADADPQEREERYEAAILEFYGPQGPFGWSV